MNSAKIILFRIWPPKSYVVSGPLMVDRDLLPCLEHINPPVVSERLSVRVVSSFNQAVYKSVLTFSSLKVSQSWEVRAASHFLEHAQCPKHVLGLLESQDMSELFKAPVDCGGLADSAKLFG